MEGCGKCLNADCDEEACKIKCPGHDEPTPEGYTITLVVGAGTVEVGTSLTYNTDADGKLVGILPEPEATAAHWTFDNWYDAETGGNAIVEAETVFTEDATIYARYTRDDGVWLGDTFKAALSINGGRTSRVEYWLGGTKITLAKGDIMSLYIDGELIRHYVEDNSAGITMPAASAQVTQVTVSVAGQFEIYLHKNANDWSCQYSGPTEVIVGSEIPAGCDMFTVTMGTNKINFFLKDASVKPVSKADFSKFCIYTYNSEIFGGWDASPTKGKLQEEMTVTTSAVPQGWIFRWGSNYSTQTADIKAFVAGKTYLVELKAKPTASIITELTLSSVNTITLDANYEGQPETKATARAYNGKLTYLPTITREGYDLAGWYDAAEGGNEITLDKVYTADTTIYARWSLANVVTFDLNYDGQPETKDTAPAYGGKLSTLPTPVRDNYDFLGWFTEAEDGEAVKLADVYTADTTIYARWAEGKVVSFSLNYDDATGTVDSLTTTNGKLAKLPADPIREGYDFGGWYTVDTATGGSKLYTSTNITANVTYYARWTVGKTVTFDLNYDEQPEEKQTATTTNKLISTLPTPEREGYTFDGWYTTKTGGTKVTETKIYSSNTTIYAHWTAIETPEESEA